MPFLNFSASFGASSSSTSGLASSTSERMSPMPRMREAMRSGWKASRPSIFSRDADELDRLAGHVAHRERRAAARIAVELGEHHAGERQRLVERAARR